ncbi:hypothetical protein HQ587_10730 [bacterium]|nr:hypothetical protein [bacterium]
MKITEPPACPHCGDMTKKMEMPMEAAYDGSILYVCFNDDCPYFIKGWQWMWDNYRVKTSYRHRVNPVNGTTGPLPVWSKDAMKDRILS